MCLRFRVEKLRVAVDYTDMESCIPQRSSLDYYLMVLAFRVQQAAVHNKRWASGFGRLAWETLCRALGFL